MSQEKKPTAFEAANQAPQQSLFSEMIGLLRENKKYWLIPLLLALLALGALVMLGGTAAAPFIYTLF